MEASMARKRAATNPHPAPTNGVHSGGDLPTQSGAMDSLLEKLRAAAPQARGQRDRRRRARLKERHQVRIASGQRIPDDLGAGGAEDGEDDGTDGDHEEKDDQLDTQDAVGQQYHEAAAGKEAQLSEGEDVADRAASMLEGLRNNNNNASDSNSERTRRRRESANEERLNRRMRRRNGMGNSISSAAQSTKDLPSPTKTDIIPEAADDDAPHAEEETPSTPPPPSIVVSSAPDPEIPVAGHDGSSQSKSDE